MNKNTGVYKTTKKNGDIYYRTSITYKRKHISLGSYDDFDVASKVYTECKEIIADISIGPDDYSSNYSIPYNKFISIINLRDNGIYFPTPIYLRKQFFEYHLSKKEILKFDRDDLFFYAAHTIQKRGGYLFISDYGSQYKILSRYGIKPFAVYGRDYIMVNGDKSDYRYSNIKIINNYIGVQLKEDDNLTTKYTAQIHINGNYIIGHYNTEIEAAVAYNKAVDTLHSNGFNKAFLKNYIMSLKKDEYLDLYSKTVISKKIKSLINKTE